MSSTGAVARHARGLPDMRFVGSHPMCGSEKKGPTAFVADLFQGRLCMIMDVPPEGADARIAERFATDRDRVEALWRAVGMQVFRVDPDRHDEIVAYLSHGPHLIAGLLTIWARDSETVVDSMERSPLRISGGGFKSMARIAGSNPEMWYDIVDTNRASILDGMRRFANQLEDLISLLENGKGDEADREAWHAWLNRARDDRDFLVGGEGEQ